MVSPQMLQFVGRLSRDEQAELVEYLQDELSGRSEVAGEVKELLDERLSAMDVDLDGGRPWPDVETDLRRRLRRATA